MHLDLARDAAKSMPVVPNAAHIESLSVWHCKYQTLEPLHAFHALRSLKIATFPNETFEFLTGLSNLQWLSVVHLPKVSNLESLAGVSSLRFLELQTLPSWDSSSKRTVVRSLAPLLRLRNLEHISLLGVVPEDRSLTPLEGCTGLKSARFHGYPRKEIERFFTASAVANASMPLPGA